MNSKLKERANAKGITQVQTFDISSDTLVPISCTDPDERSSRLDLVRTDVAYDSFELQVQTCPITGTNTKTDSSATSHRDREFWEVSDGVELDTSELSCEAMFETIFDVFMINSSESLKEWQKRNRLRFSKCLTEWQKRNAIRFTKPEPSQLCDIEAQKESSNLASITPDPNPHSLSSSIEPSYGEGSVINEETRDAGRVKVLRGGILREGHSSRVDRDDQGIPLGAQHQDGRPDQERNGQDWDQHQHACRIGREMQGPRDSVQTTPNSTRSEMLAKIRSKLVTEEPGIDSDKMDFGKYAEKTYLEVSQIPGYTNWVKETVEEPDSHPHPRLIRFYRYLKDKESGTRNTTGFPKPPPVPDIKDFDIPWNPARTRGPPEYKTRLEQLEGHAWSYHVNPDYDENGNILNKTEYRKGLIW